jgi:hypothetical protein
MSRTYGALDEDARRAWGALPDALLEDGDDGLVTVTIAYVIEAVDEGEARRQANERFAQDTDATGLTHAEEDPRLALAALP